MSRTIRARKKSAKKKQWWDKTRYNIWAHIYRGEPYDNSVLWRKDKTRPPLKWRDWVHRDGKLNHSYTNYWTEVVKKTDRAVARETLHNYVVNGDEDYLFLSRKEMDRSWFWD